MSEAESQDPALDSTWEGVARTAAGAWSTGLEDTEAELLRELLVFELDGSAYAISVERIREIVRMRPLTLSAQVARLDSWGRGASGRNC